MDIGYIYLRNHESYDKYDCYKLGKTLNIPERENLYITGEIKRGEFISVYEVRKTEMDKIEMDLKKFFCELNIYEGGGTEFFKKSIIDKIPQYFNDVKIWNNKLEKNEIIELTRTSREKNNHYNNKIDIVNENNFDYNKCMYMESINKIKSIFIDDIDKIKNKVINFKFYGDASYKLNDEELNFTVLLYYNIWTACEITERERFRICIKNVVK